MKRNFLLLALASAFGLALLGSASQALAQCTGGTVLGGATGAKYAIKVFGAVQDVGGSGTGATTVDYPSPVGIGGIGVIQTNGACGITGGEFIFFDGTSITGPGTLPPPNNALQGFQGTLGSQVTGSYSFNSNNAGTLTLVDAANSETFTFGVTVETGNSEFRGARLDAGNPVSIIGEKQAAVVTMAQFETASTVLFDAPGTGGEPGSTLGVGGGAVQAQVVEHVDPLTGMTDLMGGGGVVFNQNGGEICDNISFATSCVPFAPGAVIGDVTTTYPLPGPNLADGTQNTQTTFNGDFGFPLAGAGFNQSSVLWGSTNQNGFVMTTGSAGAAETSASLATAGKNTAAGTVHLSAGALTIVTPANDAPAFATLTITNDSVEPMDFTSITPSAGLPDVVVSGGTCNSTGGDVASDQPIFGPGICTVILQGSAFSQCTPVPSTSCHASGVPYACCTGAGTGTCAGVETGTLLIANNTHTIVPGTQTAAGVTIPVTCK